MEAFLICFRDMITRDNKVARRVFDAFKVPKITQAVCLPNVQDRSRFEDFRFVKIVLQIGFVDINIAASPKLSTISSLPATDLQLATTFLWNCFLLS